MTRPAAMWCVLAVALACGGGQDAPLPVLGAVPAFQLTDQRGEPFDSAALAGRPWIAAFIFTRCPDVCPAITGTMRRIQDGLAADGTQAALVSISVDPAYDTPERLRDYAARAGAGADWHFLTGDRDRIAGLLRDGFKVAFADDGPPAAPITHSDRLVLVDGDGRVRAYYHGRLAAEVDRVVADAARVSRGAS